MICNTFIRFVIVPPPLEEVHGKRLLRMNSEIRVQDLETIDTIEVNLQFYVARRLGIAGHCLTRASMNPDAMSQSFFLFFTA